MGMDMAAASRHRPVLMRHATVPTSSRRSRVLLFYLSRELVLRVATTGAILVALMEILALLEQLTPILERHLGLGGVLYFTLLRAPMLLGTICPLAVLIGALLLLVQMTTNSEIAILRAAGLSTPGLVALCLPAVLGLGLADMVLDDQVTPRTELVLAQWWNETDPHPEAGHGFWFRSGATLVDVGYAAEGGRLLCKVDLYRRDAAGRLTQASHLDSARYAHGHWIGGLGRGLHVASVSVRPAALPSGPIRDLDGPDPLTPAQVMRLAADTPPLSAAAAISMLQGRAPSSQPPGYLRTALLDRALTPLTFVVMLLLALPVVYIPPRTGTRSWLPVWCLGAGLLFVVFQGLLRALGNAGTLPALLATLPGVVIFTCAVGVVMLRIEER